MKLGEIRYTTNPSPLKQTTVTFAAYKLEIRKKSEVGGKFISEIVKFSMNKLFLNQFNQ